MIHTVELIKVIHYADYYHLIQNTQYKGSNTVRYYDKMKDCGIKIALYEQKVGGMGNLKVQLNFSKLKNANEQVKLVKAADLPKLVKEAEKLLYEAISDLNQSKKYLCLSNLKSFEKTSSISLSDFKIHRVDYAVQLSGLSQAEIDAYIAIYNEGNLRKWNKSKTRYKTSCNKKNNSVKVNIYDKAAERKEHKADEWEINRAKGILRVEFQCLEDKLYAMTKSKKFAEYNLSKDEPASFLNADVSRCVIRDYLKEIGYQSEHITLNEARKRIQTSSYNQQKKDSLINLIKEASKPRITLDKVKDNLYKDNTRLFASHIKDLEGLNINPIILPRDGKITYLPNLLTLIEEQWKSDDKETK